MSAVTKAIAYRRRLLPELSRMARAVAATRSLIYPRIFWRALTTPRQAPGAITFPFGRVHYTDAISLRTMYLQIFVDRVYDVDGLGAEPTMIDCGGNIGLNVIAFKRRYPRAQVTTFEADPIIAATLRENIAALQLSDVEVVSAAVGAQPGHTSFLPNGALGGHVISDELPGVAFQSAISVPQVRLSECITRPVDVLKLDIEGSEYAVLADLCDSGRIDLVQRVICEVHAGPSTQPAFARLWAQLTRAGFHISLRDVRSVASAPRPPFPVIPGELYAVYLYAWRP